MATRKPMYLDGEGFPTEFDPDSDSLTLESLTINGTAGIALVSGTVTNVPTPSAGTDVVNKDYVDGVAQGLDIKDSVYLATTSGIGGAATYAPAGGVSTEGQWTLMPLAVDGVTTTDGDRILVKDQTDQKQNGIYVVSTPTTTWDRAVDMDEDAEVSAGAFAFVEAGSTHADSGWVITSDDPHVLNTDNIVWSQFSGAGQITAAAGLLKSGNQIDVELDTAADAQGAGADGGASGLEFDASGVAGKLRAKVDGSGGIQRTGAGLALELTGTILSVGASGLTAAVAHSDLSGVGTDDHHAESHTIASHNDTTATGAELDELTDGSTTSLHQHAGVSEAERVENAYITDGVGVTIGDPVYFSANGVVSLSDASNADANQTLGLAKTTVGATTSVDIVSDGRLNAVLTGAVAGDQVYLATGGGLTQVKPVGGGARLVLCGFAVNATDLHVEINFLGRLN